MSRRARVWASAILLLAVGTTPAYAHDVSGAGAGNFRTTLRGVTPAVPGITVRVVENGSRLELTNHTTTDAVVLGYDGEPYLRIGPSGVYTNAKSPATYVNASRTGKPVPPDADSKAAPVWDRVATGRTGLWHDHRIHWMGSGRPPVVQAQPGRYHVISEWTVPVDHGGTRLTVAGRLGWVPGPSPLPWFALALAVFAAVVGAARARPRATLVVATASVILVDVVHTVGIAAENAGPWTVAARYVATNSGVSVVAWLTGIAALVLFRRGRDIDAGYLAVFTGGAIAAVGGLYDLATLSASTPPFAMPAVVARLAVALSLGLGAGIAASVVVRTLRARPAPAGGRGQVAT